MDNEIKNLRELKEHLETILWEPVADILDHNSPEAIGEAKAFDYIIDIIEAGTSDVPSSDTRYKSKRIEQLMNELKEQLAEG